MKAKKRKTEQFKEQKAPESEFENTGEFNDNDTNEEVHFDTDAFIPQVKVEVTSDIENNEYSDNMNNEICYNPDSINHVDNMDKGTDYNPENGVIVEMSGSATGVNTSEQTDTPLSLSAKRKRKIKKKTPDISMIEGEMDTSNLTVSERKMIDYKYHSWV